MSDRPRSTRSTACCASSTARGADPVLLASSAAQEHELGEVELDELGRIGTASHERQARSRCASASASPNTASAWRAAAIEATSASGA